MRIFTAVFTSLALFASGVSVAAGSSTKRDFGEIGDAIVRALGGAREELR